jgi:hypothetical protein
MNVKNMLGYYDCWVNKMNPYKLHIINTLIEVDSILFDYMAYEKQQLEPYDIQILHDKLRARLINYPLTLQKYCWMLPLIPE